MLVIGETKHWWHVWFDLCAVEFPDHQGGSQRQYTKEAAIDQDHKGLIRCYACDRRQRHRRDGPRHGATMGGTVGPIFIVQTSGWAYAICSTFVEVF